MGLNLIAKMNKKIEKLLLKNINLPLLSLAIDDCGSRRSSKFSLN